MTEENHSDSEGAFAVSMGSMQRHHVNQWLVDSGASSHMTREKMNYVEFEKPGLVMGRRWKRWVLEISE